MQKKKENTSLIVFFAIKTEIQNTDKFEICSLVSINYVNGH